MRRTISIGVIFCTLLASFVFSQPVSLAEPTTQPVTKPDSQALQTKTTIPPELNPQWIFPIAAAFVSSLFVGIVTAIVTVRLSLGRFRAERWWERKVEIYSRIVEALNTSIEYCQMLAGDFGQVSDSRRTQLTEECEMAFKELRKITGIGAFIISPKISEILQRISLRTSEEHDQSIMFYWERDHSVYHKALAEIRELAKKDLLT